MASRTGLPPHGGTHKIRARIYRLPTGAGYKYLMLSTGRGLPVALVGLIPPGRRRNLQNRYLLTLLASDGRRAGMRNQSPEFSGLNQGGKMRVITEEEMLFIAAAAAEGTVVREEIDTEKGRFSGSSYVCSYYYTKEGKRIEGYFP